MKTGKIQETVLRLSILNQLHTKNENVLNGAAVGADCAVFEVPDGKVLVSCTAEAPVTTEESFGVAKVFRQTMGQLVCKCVNNLASMGAFPAAASITLLLSEREEKEQIRHLMADADEACGKYGMEIAGGQSRVLQEITGSLAVIHAYGTLDKEKYHALNTARPGLDIVASKWAGLQGTAFLARLEKDKLNTRYPSRLAEIAMEFENDLSIAREAKIALENGASSMHDASEGGIFAALWELAQREGVGFEVDMRKIPLRQETVEVCECLGINPYELMSGGCLIMLAEDGEKLVKALEIEKIPSVIIGRTTSRNARILRNEDEVRYMDKPHQDEVFRFLEESGYKENKAKTIKQRR